MANKHLSRTLAQFSARIHRTKNRLVAIPASTQRAVGLARRQDNHLVQFSIRRSGGGRWNHHIAQLTCDNELAIPSNVTALQPGDAVDVRLHAFFSAEPIELQPRAAEPSGAAALLAALDPHRAGWRTDGAARHDEYARADMRPQTRK